MLKIREENRYLKDLKLLKKRSYNLTKLHKIVIALSVEDDLPSNARPHKLKGEYNGLWECHIEPDWLLIYNVDNEHLHLLRTGTHADLFKKYS
jgi:mRNA interferase YafQ